VKLKSLSRISWTYTWIIGYMVRFSHKIKNFTNEILEKSILPRLPTKYVKKNQKCYINLLVKVQAKGYKNIS
jgi:hypothetical protein